MKKSLRCPHCGHLDTYDFLVSFNEGEIKEINCGTSASIQYKPDQGCGKAIKVMVSCIPKIEVLGKGE